MPPPQSPADLPELRQPSRDHRTRPTSASGYAADSPGLSFPSDDEFLSRFGDAIDDRIAEILDELLTERSSAREHRRLPYPLAALSLILAALTVTVVLRHSPIVWVVWPATAVGCVASGIRSR
ncbi:MAG TPA: hypothetical protein VMA73_21545 [Streptosporangiaceae bacterium]|nr:hypothetical protein [Streptosporangiaceae bacterium]